MAGPVPPAAVPGSDRDGLTSCVFWPILLKRNYFAVKRNKSQHEGARRLLPTFAQAMLAIILVSWAGIAIVSSAGIAETAPKPPSKAQTARGAEIRGKNLAIKFDSAMRK